MGPDSKMIITGDPTQVDLPSNQRSGLTEATRILKDVKGITFVELTDKDVVRHRLVKDIIEAYGKEGLKGLKGWKVGWLLVFSFWFE